MNTIRVTNAHLHNLKNLTLEIPRQQLVAITGVSGSGKSTLAFDLIYEQARRRYLQAIGMVTDLAEEIGCERISGLGPVIAVQQGIIRQSNPRSSVGTRSGIFTFLRLLYVYEGQMVCPACGAQRRVSEACPQCKQPAPGLQSGFFSYNSSLGMCLGCQGHGMLFELNMDRLLPTPETTLRQMLANTGSDTTFRYLLRGMLKEYADRPFLEAPEEVRHNFLYGIPLGNGRVSHNLFEHLKWKYIKGREVKGCISHVVCPECHGDRVSAEARRVTLAGYHIGQLSHMALTELVSFFQSLEAQPALSPLGCNLLKDILHLVHTLVENGLAHLTLYRSLPSLSGGELQRLFLSTHIHSQMESLIYVLDEPTFGLHEVEKQRLLNQLKELQSQGNTILLVEHDPHLVAAADHIIDIGPLAGPAGGRLVYQGDYAGLLAARGSLTGEYLSGRAALPARKKLTVLPGGPALSLSDVSTHNLQALSVCIPLGRMVGVAGVSGSGKSSLVIKTLVPLLERHFARRAEPNGEADDDLGDDLDMDSSVFSHPISGCLAGAGHIHGFSAVSQQAIGRHENSNPATYLKIWGPIRRLFARTEAAQARGFGPGDFSFNAGGACPTCSGSGKKRIWLGGAFFASQVCPDCRGRRFLDEVLEFRWHGRTILEVLEMTATEACDFFAGQKNIVRVLEVLVRSGMGYLPLGQPAPTLSGGEAQRVKLALEISRARRNHILYILDEPTLGLSLYDTGRLLQLLDELVSKGNSVLVVEHDPAILSQCDWIIELGPGGGNEGGRLVAAGTPTQLRANPASITGPYLHPQGVPGVYA